MDCVSRHFNVKGSDANRAGYEVRDKINGAGNP
jgi:hypothetical protein